MSKSILFITSNSDTLLDGKGATGYYIPELVHPLNVLRAAGYSVDFASLKGGLSKVVTQLPLGAFKADY